ncbi:deoxyhypusine synthase family protein [Candidatus Micrarchaeota archaeon]|nr:deoxyhypusine synthase family protein [Candidatus Micrarchaeota archaeon]
MASRQVLFGPKIATSPITGNEKTRELFEKAFPAFVGRQVRNGYQVIERMVREDCAIVLSLSGAMTPADLGSSCVVPLIKAGFVDVLTTTGANLYHDAHRLIGKELYAVDPNYGDCDYRKSNVIRVYDVGFEEDVLLDTDKLFTFLLSQPPYQRAMTTPEFHYQLGTDLAKIAEQRLGDASKSNSLLVQAALNRVPVFCGAPQDGSIFLNAVKLARMAALGEKEFKFSLDLARDVYEFAALHYYAKNHATKKLAVIVVGGGVPKNYSLQPEPTLSQILFVETNGYDYDVQICDTNVDNGALSSCTAGEGHTWGKTSAECVVNSQYVHCDATAVLPFYVHALLQSGLRKTPRRFLEKRAEALSLLDAAVKQKLPALRKTLEFP